MRLPVISGLVLLVGLAITAWGLDIMRTFRDFDFLPSGLRAALAHGDDVFGNTEAMIVGGVVALVGAVVCGLAVGGMSGSGGQRSEPLGAAEFTPPMAASRWAAAR